MEVNLREQVMINQFVLAAGCTREQAIQILSQAGWQFQTALSIYFQEAVIPRGGANFALITPANTPATPPNFPDALTMLSNMSTTDKMATSPKGNFSTNRFYSTSPSWGQGACANHLLSPNRLQTYGYQNNVNLTPPKDLESSTGHTKDQRPKAPSPETGFTIDDNFLSMEMEGTTPQ